MPPLRLGDRNAKVSNSVRICQHDLLLANSVIIIYRLEANKAQILQALYVWMKLSIDFTMKNTLKNFHWLVALYYNEFRKYLYRFLQF